MYKQKLNTLILIMFNIGKNFFSGFSGQVDFIRHTAKSNGGKPIIAIPSTTKNITISSVVSIIRERTGITTSRGDLHFVVTEYVITDLFGKIIRQTIKSLIDIAHPNFISELENYAIKYKLI